MPTPPSLDLPASIEALADELMTCPGAEAVVVGGSRAIGRSVAGSDWDLGLHYRGEIDLEPLTRRGEVHPPGSWGRIMNGGAWLDVDGTRVDVLLRDLDVVEHWAAEATGGRFEIDGLPGYVAGITTYSLVAEIDCSLPIRGRVLLDSTFPPALAVSGPERWRFNRDFSLHHAASHAERGITTAALGMASKAVLEEAHARCCQRRRWALNEKHLLAAAGLGELDRLIEVMLAEGAPVAAVVADLGRRFPTGS